MYSSMMLHMTDWAPDDSSEWVWRSLQMMEGRIHTRLARRLSEQTVLSHADYVVLAVLNTQPDGWIRVVELADALGWEQSRVSHHIARMTRRGLIEKSACPEDRRGTYLVATPLAQDEFHKADKVYVAAIHDMFIDHLSPDDLDTVRAVARKVLAALDRAEQAEDR